MIDPCVPSYVKEYSVDRTYRGAVYHIHVGNPDGVEKGVVSLQVNGEEVPGNVIPVQPKDSEVDVRVIMG